MKKTGVGLLMAAALWLFPAHGMAQDAPAEGEAAPAAEGEVAGEAEAGAEVGAEGEIPGADVPGGEGLDDICKIDPAACPNLNLEKEAQRQFVEPLYAVQQLFALRVRRFELNPYWAVTLNDQFVDHPAPGLSLNYYITNVLAVGVNGNYYEPFNADKDFNAQVRRAARVAVPLTEYQWEAGLNFTYVFAYGKFAGFSDFIFHYDAYVLGGVGVISTRPIPVIDPDNRNFKYETRLTIANPGIGLRIFFNRWFAAMLEVRDYIFIDQLENLEVDVGNPQDQSTWLGEQTLTNAVQAQLGVSIFLPFSFEYRLPK